MPSRFILTPPFNWISQELSSGDNGECTYMQDISIDDMECEQLSKSFIVTSDIWVADSINQMKETPVWVMSIWQTRIFLWGGDKSATVAGAHRFEYITASGGQVNYFLDSTNILQTNELVTSITNTRSHAGGTITASVLIYNKILFSIGSTIYEYDLASIWTAPVSLATSIPILTGISVKNMYFYNDMLIITWVMNNNTYHYMVQYTSSWWEIYSTEEKKWLACVWAIGDWGIVYWITNSKIFYFSGGQSSEIRYIGYNSNLQEYTFTSTPKLAFDNWNLLIAGGTTIWKFGKKHSGRRISMTIRTCPRTILAITGNYIHAQATTNYLYSESSKYPDSGYSITIPYDAGIYGDEKSNLAFRVGYRLPTWTSITIGIMTDTMEMENTANYVTVATITDTSKRRQLVTVNEINQALATAWKNSDWQSIRFKRTLIGGGGTSGLRDNTPKLYDIKCIHNDINDGLE